MTVKEIIRDIELGKGSDDYKDWSFGDTIKNIKSLYAIAEAFKEYATLRGDPDIVDAIDNVLN